MASFVNNKSLRCNKWGAELHKVDEESEHIPSQQNVFCLLSVLFLPKHRLIATVFLLKHRVQFNRQISQHVTDVV